MDPTHYDKMWFVWPEAHQYAYAMLVLSSMRAIYWGEQNLRGRIPRAVGMLGNLVYLFLHNNRLEGQVPSEIGYLSDESSSAPSMRTRSWPNILITGTPGTGKTVTAATLAQAIGMVHVEVGQIVKEKALHDGYDQVFDSLILNEDKVVDELEEMMQEGGKIVDHHSCDFFPERWFDLVVVLRANNEILYPRLEKRGYSTKKITENIECEIMDVVHQEARDSYDKDIVVELRSESLQDMEQNIARIEEWIMSWRSDNINTVE
ncbi:hypothetical protein HDU82_000524 [Entophlyctis luteolus]|nr:hypothetical protein HDU82_000524 [Entophlyctis luteolus]